MQVKQILSAMAQYQPSDLHLQVGCPPAVRVQGVLTPAKTPPLEESQLGRMLQELAPPEIWSRIEAGENRVFMHVDAGQGRYRVSVFRHGGRLAAALRVLPFEIPTLEALALPEFYRQITEARQGLIIVGGRAASGRTTTVAALVHAINAQRVCKIVEVSDAIEYEHASKKAMVVQIQLGRDAPALQQAFDALAYQNPDVLVLGDLNDWAMAQRALAGCDSGLLVIASMLAVTAQQALERLRGSIPEQIKTLAYQSLAMNLEAICCQRLCRRKEGHGRVPATELLRRGPAVTGAVEEGEFSKLDRAMATGQQGMRTFDQDLDRLFREKLVTEQEAMRVTLNPDSMQMLMRGFGARTK